MNTCPICLKDTAYRYCSLSCSGFSRRPKNEAKYNLSPKQCCHCSTPIPYHKRFTNIFCSHSCSAKSSNSLRQRISKKEIKPKQPTTIERFQLGLITTRETLRRCLQQTIGFNCFVCNQKPFWRDKPLVLVVDHCDGDASNNMPENLRLLCPHCNSQTDTFSGRNKGKGRKSRRLPR